MTRSNARRFRLGDRFAIAPPLGSVLWLVLVLGFALPALADEKPADQPAPDEAVPDEPAPEEDTILGTWYLQLIDRNVTPLDEPTRLVFNKDGTVHLYEGEELDELGTYVHDKDKAVITIYDGDNPTDVDEVLKYSFIDDMLVMRDGSGRGDEDDFIELTRKPEGTERHQKLRQGEGKAQDPGRRAQTQRMVHLRQLYTAAIAYQLDMEKPADSIGDLVVKGYIELKAALPVPPPQRLPKDFGEWQDAEKAKWINRLTGCVFLPVDLEGEAPDKQIALIDLPFTTKQEKITLVFGDGHSEIKPYADANKLVKKQTGYTLEQWMKSSSPGSGAAPPKEDDEARDKK